MYKYNTRSILV